MGSLIVFEGADGTGKTTVIQRIAEKIEKRVPAGMRITVLREPTQGQYGKEIREAANKERYSPLVETALFTADRVEHVRTEIQPARRQPGYVLLDRYYFSTAAYQGARGMNVQDILEDSELFCPRPDLVVFLTCDTDVAMKRVGDRGATDLFESTEYQKRVADVYASIAKSYRYVSATIDTTDKDADGVEKAVIDFLCSNNATLRLLLR